MRDRLRAWLRAAMAVALIASVGAAVAQDCALEEEPNDIPANARPLGEQRCLAGALEGNDQDTWMWEVTEDDATTPWVVEMEGIPDQLTKLDIVRVTFADNGVDVTAAETLWTFGTRDGRHVASEPILLAPGRYILGFSKSGGSGEYFAGFRPQESLTRFARPFDRLAEGSGEIGGFGPVDGAREIAWSIGEEDAAHLWDIEVRVGLGDAVDLTLEGADGELASSGRGTLGNLGLDAGDYTLRLSGSAGTAFMETRRGAKITDGSELEPNDNWSNANALPMDRALVGSGGNDDYFVFDIDEEAASTAWDLVIEADAQVYVYLYDEGRAQLQERRGHSGRLRDLVFEPGSYGFAIDAPEGSQYTLRFEERPLPEAGFEREPNDHLPGATDLGVEPNARGSLTGSDEDTFRFRAEGEAQLWRVQVVGAGVRELEVLDGSGSVLQSTHGERRLRLDNLRLLPGANYLRVSGEEGDYALRALPLGPAPEPEPEAQPAADETLVAASSADADAEAADAPTEEPDEADPEEGGEASAAPPEVPDDPLPPPPPGRMELEPNDDQSRSELLRAGEVRVGRHATVDPHDVDLYRFFLAHDQLVRIEAVPPEGGAIRFDVTGAPRTRPVEEGGATVLQRWLPAGDHFVETWADVDVAGYYQLRLTLLDPLALPVDLEPNDERESAARMPSGLVWEGVVGNHGDPDLYRLPVFERETAFTVRAGFEGGNDVRYDFFDEDGRIAHEEEDGEMRVMVPAETPVWWRIRGNGRYQVEASFESQPPAAELRPDPHAGGAAVSFDATRQDVTAYWHEGQTVRSSVRVENTADGPRRYRLEARTGNAAVEARLGDEEVALAPGEAAELPVVVRVPPDARDDQPVTVTVAARSDTSVDTGTLQLVPRCEATPVEPGPMWRVPDTMLGGLNVAWSGLGARAVAPEPDGFTDLFDGRTAPSTGVYRGAGESITVELASEEPVDLTGTLLHPQSRARKGLQLRDFRVETSLDGERFETVVEGRLETARIEQAFAFDAPVRARYARLTFLDNHQGDGRNYLGAWKLIAAPDAPRTGVNLADPSLGGHVVWSDPLHRADGRILTPAADDVGRLDLDGLDEATWTIGFHHDRAARIARLEWVESPDAEPEQRFDEVRVEVSLAGPVGPWTELETWALDRVDGTATLELEEPVWARFLRFTAPRAEPEQRYAYAPGALRVLEAPADDGYRSAVGAWDHYGRDAVYEWASRRDTPVRRLEQDDHDDRASAHPLASGERIEGSVAVAEDEDWYRLTVEEGQNALQIQLRGDPSIAYEYALTDADGEPVFLEADGDGHDATLTAFVEPGDYYLRLHEPKRSVVFSWDTSGSVSPYQATTYNALAGFATDVDADSEAVQMLAFDNPMPIWLLPYWSSDPERVQTALNQFDRNANSSDAEQALLVATEALASRDGTRAILFMTDAESPGYSLTPDLWRALSEVQPRVFTFEISTAGSDYSQDMMQAWASVNQGFYDYARNVADFDIGFARASCHLRRPKRYEVEVATRTVEPPGPGSLSVVRAEGADLPALEVIFDASGSMGAPLPNGRPRIDVAKEVLGTLVSDILPEGTPFAFRAFGHIAPQSCETRLDVPLTPLDPDVARQAFDAIQPKLLSQTPIADSLREVAADLGGTDAAKAVVLITDGEESCGGDPEAVLGELQDAGVDVRLSIVSLGLDEEAARERFAALAEFGGGTYVDAQDRESLEASVEAALYPTFEVLDGDGQVVARGSVAGPGVELPMGVYTVRVPGSPPEVFRDVRVPGDSSVSVTLGDGR